MAYLYHTAFFGKNQQQTAKNDRLPLWKTAAGGQDFFIKNAVA